MRKMMIRSFIKYAEGQIAKRKVNVEVYLERPVGIGEHSNIMEAIEVELEQMAKYDEQIAVLKKYFVHDEESKEEDVTYSRKKY